MRFLDTPRDRARALVLALGLAILVAVAPFVTGLIGAGVLYVIFASTHRRVAALIGARSAAALVAAAAVLLLLIPGVLLAALMIDRAPHILRGLEESAFLTRLAALRVGELDVGARLAAAGEEMAAWASRRAFDLFGSIVRGTLNAVVALFGLYFLLLSGRTVWARVKAQLPFSSESAETLRARFRSVTEAMLLDIALTATLQGTVVGLSFSMLGLPDALFWGTITAFVSVLPVLGSSIVWGPGALVLAAAGRAGAALALVAIGAGVASNIDNVTRLVVFRRVSHIHPMTTLVGAFAGVALFGVIGVLLGPLAISYFFELMRIYEREYGARPATAPVERLQPLAERTPTRGAAF